MQLPNEVDEGGVHLDFLVPPPVPHEVIERLQRLGDVFAIPLEGYGDRILRVNVVHGERAVLSLRPAGQRGEKSCTRNYKPQPFQAQGNAALYKLHSLRPQYAL